MQREETVSLGSGGGEDYPVLSKNNTVVIPLPENISQSQRLPLYSPLSYLDTLVLVLNRLWRLLRSHGSLLPRPHLSVQSVLCCRN